MSDTPLTDAEAIWANAVDSEDTFQCLHIDDARALERRIPTWRPIETAPRDGTTVLLAGPKYEHGCVIAFWSDPTVGDTTDGESGWYLSECDSSKLFEAPTAWQPLPEPPK